MCVCVSSHISPLECLFVLKILSRTQLLIEVQYDTFVPVYLLITYDMHHLVEDLHIYLEK